ncbi:MAG: 16S rRNA (cytidine(1402)-2'-O)-methyltransferase [Alphaproteobacteria bacterium]|nr:16S rRNA (cytidine(1402)-2'-O)-methyltransferase [Alphaproteobacteria bacterium]
MSQAKDLSQKPMKQTIKPGLYLVATPVGNLRDITLRALDMLEACDALICEDSRVSGGLLSAYGLKKELIVYNDHASDKQRDMILSRLKTGQTLAMVSDAGTPLVSDPGYKLVRMALADDIYVSALPGASAPLLALQLSGLPSDSFSFAGFLPVKTKARQETLERWSGVPGTLLMFETAPRLIESLKDMKAVLGDRPACVARELTKLYEESRRGLLSQLISHYEEKGPPKGEIVVAVGAVEGGIQGMEDIIPALRRALDVLGTRQASRLIADIYDRPGKEVYNLALSLSGKSEE